MASYVWKVTETEYYTRSLSKPNRYGNIESACSRKVISWSAIINGKIVKGFATKREAMAAVNESVTINIAT